MNISANQARILISTIAAGALPAETAKEILAELVKHPESNAITIAKTFGCPKIIRNLTIATKDKLAANSSGNLEEKNNQIIYQGQIIGRTQILYKSPLPGELQAKLAIETAIDRFLEYLQKLLYIVVLDESDRHVRVFIPVTKEPANFSKLWKQFLEEVAFSAYGNTIHKLPGLVQTFIVMLNAVTLSGRGFSTLDVPILTQEQANVLAAWYYAVIRDVRKRQEKRQQDIEALKRQLENPELTDKDRKSKAKELQDKEAMQEKEAKKYTEYFQKAFTKSLEEQNAAWQELSVIQEELANSGLAKTEQRKLQKQQDKLSSKLVFLQEFIQQKLKLIQEAEGDPFKFVQLDEKQNPDIFKQIVAIAKNFDKRATDQINSTRGDIFTQCVTEMYRLLELKPTQFEPTPEPLLTEKFVMPEMRSPGDDSKEFCYSCGVALDPKTARWQVLRFMFERPSQRRQSSSGEGRPHICSSCSALAFASPLKVTEESIIIQLDSANKDASELKIKDYIRMLASKEIHLSAGKYLILASDRTSGGELASQKLGKIQYAIAKVASIFPLEVLTDFNFYLVIQGTQPITLASRHLIFVKGLMDCYKQSTVISGKDINITLGDAVRYMQQDLPFLADYTLAKSSNFCTDLHLEKVREMYWKKIHKDVELKGDSMDSDNQLPKRARLYRDVAALTGLTYAFAQSLESTAKGLMKAEDAEREVSKLIEKVDDAISFSYYATLGDQKKTSVQARLYHYPDCDFIYSQTRELLNQLAIPDREKKDDQGKLYLQLYADDVTRAYQHFATSKDYAQEKDWKELTYNLKLSLYTRFPELVRKLKSTSEKN
ncbi:hypothetical protein [Aerosakkonema funiforme]|uniref:Uncharacterized protein n=2 Tax=Oscillatoriophycideae TaxID=1301283 RepID=A0A926VHB7_9CYAN|nr:hypothetical protein [Aerosakkonema funiforme]MBD2183916.1 hypothetical protein [Aerosakkonema funiforme FACHB-1375]